MITYNIDVFIGRNAPERKTVVKCHDTGVCLSVVLMTEERTSKWRTLPKLYTPPVDTKAVIKIKKPDGKYVLQDGERRGSSTLFFELPPQSFTAVGMAEAEINIFDADGRRVTTETFYIDVPQEVANDCAEDSETYVSVMAQQIQAAIDAAERAEEAAERAESAGGGGGTGENGATFTPSVSEDGILSWENDKELPNPPPVNIKGPQGLPGPAYVLTKEDLTKIVNSVLENISSPARIGYVTLLADKWVGDKTPYSQVVELEGVTENSQVDLTPSVEQLSIFHHKDLAFVTENDGGTVTVYAIGEKPQNDYTIQVTLTEVEI